LTGTKRPKLCLHPEHQLEADKKVKAGNRGMLFEPYLRKANDGTYELLVPLPGGAFQVLPYCFHTPQDAASWLTSRKGQEQIRIIRNRYQRRNRRSARLVLDPETAIR